MNNTLNLIKSPNFITLTLLICNILYKIIKIGTNGLIILMKITYRSVEGAVVLFTVVCEDDLESAETVGVCFSVLIVDPP